MTSSKHVCTNPLERAAAAKPVAHPLNARAVRRSLSLGDATGLTKLGVHLNVIAPGDATTESHAHDCIDEFVYIVSGRATLYLDAEEHELGPGDFAGFPAQGPAHWMKNTGPTDLVYLVGGGRADVDVCTYPSLGKRLYVVNRHDGRQRDLVDFEHISKF